VSKDQRRVGRAVLARHRKLRRPAGDRCDVDHRGSGALLHAWQRQPHHSHGLDEVLFQRAAPVVITAVGNARAAAPAADIVDQDVDAAIGRDGGLDQAGCAIGTADIGSVSRNFGAGRAQSRFRFP
jgi:hypothetical protein